ncbi:MAG: NADP(H)-dependent aldo-keto reductase [Gammaproteobacteria bacterium]
MKFRELGHTGLSVSQICLGTMTWGEQNTELEGHEQLDYAIDQGINFIDTAEMYPVPPQAETQGRTETILGTWLAKRKDRDQLIIATKVTPDAEWTKYFRNGQNCLDKKNIELALNDSLKRLQSDYVDLYQVHWPERDTNFFGKLGYTHAPDQDALGGLVKAGKIRYVGISNETPWGIAEYLRLAEKKGLPRIVSIQNPYNLLNRTFEIGAAEFAMREAVGLLAYSPLAFGTLTGKYLTDEWPSNSRLSLFSRFTRYTNEQGTACVRAYVELARKHGLDPAQMALAYVNSRPFLTSNIIGATSMEQLKTNIGSLDLDLETEVLEGIEDIHTRQPNPCP